MKKTVIKKAIDYALNEFYINGYTSTGNKFRRVLYKRLNLQNHKPFNVTHPITYKKAPKL